MANSILIDLIANDLVTGTVSSISNFATRAFSGLQGQMMEAMKLQTTFLGNAGNLSAVSGMSFDNAKGFTKELNIELARVAAELPGVTKDYQLFANSIQGVIAKNYDLSDQLGVKTFKTDLIDISKRAVLLGQASGTHAQDTAYYMKQFLSTGNTLMSLNPLSFDDRNPAFIQKVKERLDTIGKTVGDFNKMGTMQRQRILETVLKQLTPEQMIDEVKQTAESILAAWRDNLTNQDIGTFGFLRAIKSRGDRSGMDAITDLLSRVDSLGTTASRVLGKLGLTFDPMGIIIDVIDNVSRFVTGLEAGLESFKGNSPGQLVGHFANGIGDWFRSLAGQLRELDVGALAGSVIGYMSDLFASINWGSFGSSIGEFIGTALTQAVLFMARVMFSPKLFTARNDAAMGFISGLITGFFKGIFGTLFADLARSVKTQVGGFTKSLKTGLEFITDVWDKLKSLVSPLVNMAQDFANKVRDLFNFIKGLNPFSGQGVSAPVEAVSALVPQPVKDAVKGAIDAARAILPGQQPGEAPKLGQPTNPVTRASPIIQPQASNPLPNPMTNNVDNRVASANFAPVININGAAVSSPEDIARVAIQAFRQEFDRMSTQQLT